jgi:hypothetical protein
MLCFLDRETAAEARMLKGVTSVQLCAGRDQAAIWPDSTHSQETEQRSFATTDARGPLTATGDSRRHVVRNHSTPHVVPSTFSTPPPRGPEIGWPGLSVSSHQGVGRANLAPYCPVTRCTCKHNMQTHHRAAKQRQGTKERKNREDIFAVLSYI